MTFSRTLLALVATVFLAAPAAAEDAHSTPQPPAQKWSFAGPFGKFDQAQLQRGFKVYKEVCQACHSLSLVAFRTLGDPGGPAFSPAQVTAIALDYKRATGKMELGDVDALQLCMDVKNVHCNGRPLKLFEMLNGNDEHFKHDMMMIHKYVNRIDGGIPLDVPLHYATNGVIPSSIVIAGKLH